MGDLVIGWHDRDVLLPLELSADPAVERLLEDLDHQMKFDLLLLALLKMAFGHARHLSG